VIPQKERIREFSSEQSSSFSGETRFNRYSRLKYGTDPARPGVWEMETR
jgi:hypothetical protein